MKYAIICSSLTGNTKMLADEIHNYLGNKNCVYFGSPTSEIPEADIYYVGFWTNKGTCDENTENFLKTLKNSRVFLFGTAGFALDDAYLNSVSLNVSSNLDESNKLEGRFMSIGKMQMRVRDKYVANKNSEHPMPNVDMLIAGFDEALKHPNQNDFDNLINAIKEVKNNGKEG